MGNGLNMEILHLQVMQLAGDLLIAPVYVKAGKPKLLHRNVEHSAIILSPTHEKDGLFIDKLVELYSTSRVIIFANTDNVCDNVHQRLKEVRYWVSSLRLPVLFCEFSTIMSRSAEKRDW